MPGPNSSSSQSGNLNSQKREPTLSIGRLAWNASIDWYVMQMIATFEVSVLIAAPHFEGIMTSAKISASAFKNIE